MSLSTTRDRPREGGDAFGVYGVGHLPADFQRAADDKPVGKWEEASHVLGGDAAADEKAGVRTGFAHGPHVAQVGGHTGAGPGNNQGISEAAFEGVPSRDVNRDVAERRGVLHMDISEDFS